MTFHFDISILLVVKAPCRYHSLTCKISNLIQACGWRPLTALSNCFQSKSVIGGVTFLLTRNWLVEIVSTKSQVSTQQFGVGCRLLQHLGRLFVRRNCSRQQSSHIQAQFQFNGHFKQSGSVLKYFSTLPFNSSLSLSHEQIFRLLLKISVCERHQLRTQTISRASSEEAFTFLSLQHGTRPTFTNESFHQVMDILLKSWKNPINQNRVDLLRKKKN